MVKCPKCGKEVEEWRAECPYCRINFEKYNQDSRNDNLESRNNAYYLKIVFIMIIKLDNYYKDYYDNINWIGIIGGIAVLIGGLTLFFLLRTITDIYYKVR